MYYSVIPLFYFEHVPRNVSQYGDAWAIDKFTYPVFVNGRKYMSIYLPEIM